MKRNSVFLSLLTRQVGIVRARGLFVSAFYSLMIVSSATVLAGEADVVGVKIAKESAGSYRFDVTVRHDDKGWDHYANKWDVVAPDGSVLGTRVLAHPHEAEQPFTRSLSGVRIPDGVEKVTLRAHDSVHKYGGAERSVDVPR